MVVFGPIYSTRVVNTKIFKIIIIIIISNNSVQAPNPFEPWMEIGS